MKKLTILFFTAAAFVSCTKNDSATKAPEQEEESTAMNEAEQVETEKAKVVAAPSAEEIPVEADFEAEARNAITEESDLDAELSKLEAEISTAK